LTTQLCPKNGLFSTPIFRCDSFSFTSREKLRLKALVRSFAAPYPQINRHKPEELDYPDMRLAQMWFGVAAFFDRLLRRNTLEEETGTASRVARKFAENAVTKPRRTKTRELASRVFPGTELMEHRIDHSRPHCSQLVRVVGLR
jgi:hypothetical protein